ncbi:flagellar motor protein MotB [Actinomyces sp. HMSC08A09]|uniref:OmpA family protein n=1 Tax=Actinomyces sp. HMSC08A09 TaxID=1581133 RepID=UPI0008D2850E|nr:OmpA family protein [Actinomyces sp. HMSC08A09]OFT39449.1 flagellar motor protein MotB [Actinomyces sp. HMSC08A09]
MVLSALAGLGLPVLAGCDLPGVSKDKGGSASPSGSTASAGGSASASAPAQAGSTEWQKLDGHIMGHKVSVEVSPVVRQDDKSSYIAVKLTRASDDASIDAVDASSYSSKDNKLSISDYLGAGPFRAGTGASLVKLLDTASGRVWSAVNGSGLFLELAPGEDMTSYLSFGKVDTDTVTVMVPMAGFTTVSVLDAKDAKKAKIDLSIAQAALKQSSNDVPELADPVAIERYTRALDDSTSTHAGGKDITVTLASDVTFASDSAELASGAEAQLQTVAGQLGQHPDGGTLTIVGHTDDVQDDAYNQTLSEKRANAVKTRLEQLTKLDKWQTSVSGKGESEPKIKDTTDQARAANRRVEITLTPTGGTTPKNSGTATPTNSGGGGKLPEPKGPVAKGSEGVTLTTKGLNTQGDVTITLDQVTRKGGYLLGTVTCTVKDGSTGAPLHPLLDDPETALTNQRSESGAISTFYASDGLTLLSNGERIFPADYNDADVDHHLPLTELRLVDNLKTGATTICVVWPDPGGDTITLDHPEGKYSTPDTAYRLTDIPIKNS